MNTKEVLNNYIAREILNDPNLKIGDEELLVGENIISSLGVVRLVAFIEEQFGVNIPPQDVTINNFRNLSAIADYIGSLQAQAAHS